MAASAIQRSPRSRESARNANTAAPAKNASMSSRAAMICFGMSSPKGRIANLTRAYEPIGNRLYRPTFRGSP